MREEKHTADDLKIMQSLPLEIKEKMSLARIRSSEKTDVLYRIREGKTAPFCATL